MFSEPCTSSLPLGVLGLGVGAPQMPLAGCRGRALGPWKAQRRKWKQATAQKPASLEAVEVQGLTEAGQDDACSCAPSKPWALVVSPDCLPEAPSGLLPFSLLGTA